MSTIRTLLATLALAGAVHANNIAVSNITLTDLNTVADTVNVQFDVTWQNGWRVTDAPANWDAAWLFVKFHTGSMVWGHGSLDTSAANHTAPVGGTIATGITGSRAVGVFLHRSAVGTGTTTFTGVKLKWNYGLDGVADNDRVTVDVTGIEMVYVPQGAFQVGDGTTSYRFVNSAGAPFQITDAGPVPCGTAAGKLSWFYGGTQGLSGSETYQDVPTTFPNGFNAFYCMKYEPSNGERVAAAAKSGPGASSPGITAVPDRAFYSNDTSLLYAVGYLDWAGLRPMTELEYEKVCRGPVTPVSGEYAWGNAFVASAPYTLANPDTATEAIATGYRDDAGNVWYINTCSPTRPAKVGIFAIASYAGPASPRVQSGAGYYGMTEMTGNVWDYVVKWTFPTTADSGAIFAGAHGDGYIASGGSHNVPEWGSGGQIITSTSSNGFVKGGTFNSSLESVSMRYIGPGSVSSSYRSFTVRGVRTAP